METLVAKCAHLVHEIDHKTNEIEESSVELLGEVTSISKKLGGLLYSTRSNDKDSKLNWHSAASADSACMARKESHRRIFSPAPAQRFPKLVVLYVNERRVTCIKKGTVSSRIGAEGGFLSLSL